MDRETITFRLDTDKKKALDAIAVGLDRDRSYVLNQAIEAYLDVHHWQLQHVQEGLRQADAGEFATDAEVNDALAKWRKK
jgi:RHH-type transcriptional regulator, rel operon repressor / antitoxin RelB